MAPSKRWMDLVDDRLSEAYETGVQSFLNYAFKRTGKNKKIRCPCVKCGNTYSGTREVVESHLKVYGIVQNYTFWYHHGERSGEPQSESDGDDGEEIEEDESDNEMHDIIRDLYPEFSDVGRDFENSNSMSNDEIEEEPNDEAKKFYRLLRDSNQPLYDGSKSSKLSLLVKLLHIKSLGGWSNASFTMLLQLLKDDLLPSGTNFPNSYYEAKKIIQDLGLSYKKIDACINDCMLYWKEDANSNLCKVCGASRWKHDKHSGETKQKVSGKRVPMKSLRYFPLKPRLQRLFMSKKTASLMRWHIDQRVDDGVMRHPADSISWRSFNELHESFALEPRNVRLGLASDGFQPFGDSRKPYSIWPVILIPYNLPPWMCMKQSNFILSMLIPGPESPGDAIDIYLQPLINELKELWDVGVETFDVSIRQNFQLHAALLWTINDFPAYGNLSGWSTKGKLACPCCNKNTFSIRLTNGGKQCYMGHRRYLPINHKWRNDKFSFDGTKERGCAPKLLTGDEILGQVQDLEGIILTKYANKRQKISHSDRGDNWNKKSIFFELPYWKTLLLRHNLDLMHIEKNITDSILGTIMNIKGKTKDTIKSRLDLQAMHIRPELHPVRKGDKLALPHASYTLCPKEKHTFCVFFKQLRVPDGFSSNISHCVNLKEHKISGLKSHDCHVILQRLLPYAIRGLLPKAVFEPLIELSSFFTVVGSKTLKSDDLNQIEAQIPITLCKLERVFPPSFFDVMLHLPIHLANEAKIGGPSQYRSMYSIEQYLYTLKGYIRNRACPEGSIAEGYIANECMTFCSRYLHGMDTKFNRHERNYDCRDIKAHKGLFIFCQPGRAIGAGTTRDLDTNEFKQAHIYVLKNCPEVQPFLDQFSQIQSRRALEVFDKNFIEWFKIKVAQIHKQDNNLIMEDLLSLSRGPTKYVTCYNGYLINGYRFRIEDIDKGLRTQNSGVVVVGDTGSETERRDYYGVLTEIIELQYLGGRRVVLFRCNWWDVYNKEKGVKIDEYGHISVNCQRLLKTNEPFVLANQASQVFYASDNVNKGWHIVQKTQPRDIYEMPLEMDEDSNDLQNRVEAYQQFESFISINAASTSQNMDDEVN
ncbi:uncharacterized protein LOC109705831 isoform X1 [Ananas comosus]|uniref:Uncharacterized protein LOC109705831 isoform X1 n=1 Tax=Ananas comosus TaxID=4615 RepID=A0A6P5ELG2_ANACO|nr:uncharacterized protein LOC109705831 isoform X1 [Ananas comosus]